jgi:hypothetical protein
LFFASVFVLALTVPIRRLPLGSVTLAAAALQFSIRSEMIDLRVVEGVVAWANRQTFELVATTIPDDLWSELLQAAPEPGSG